MRKTFSLIFVLLTASMMQLMAEVFTIKTVPDPKQNGQEYYVSNPDGVLDQDAVNFINETCHELYTTEEVEVAVVALNAFDEENYTAHTFALDLFNDWGIGGAEKNTGVLVFLAVSSRDIEIITGGGMEGLLPDAACSDIWHAAAEKYLSDNDFSRGTCYIVQEIYNRLITDEARAELLLGFKKKEPDTSTYSYFIFAFFVLIGMALLAYKRLNGKPGQAKDKIMKEAAGTQTAIGCLSWIFPFPMLLLYLYYRYARKNIRKNPTPCKYCKTQMKLLGKDERTQYLSAQMLAEEHLGSKEYDVWLCPSCHETEILAYDGKKAKKYSECPSCGAKAFETTSSETVSQATYSSSGLRRDHKVCAYCGNTAIIAVTLPKLVRSTSSSGGGGRSYGGGGGHGF